MEEERTQRRRERITGWQKQLPVHNHLIHQKNHQNVTVCSSQHRHLEPPSTTTPSPSEIEEETKKWENKSKVNKKYRKHRERKNNHRPRASPVHNYCRTCAASRRSSTLKCNGYISGKCGETRNSLSLSGEK